MDQPNLQEPETQLTPPNQTEDGGNDVVLYPWLRQPDEPVLWFNRFSQYYLPLGASRSLLRAYQLMFATEDPQYVKEGKAMSADPMWSTKAREWRWMDRAAEYDAFLFNEATQVVSDARVRILKASDDAAKALVTALTSPRLMVAAAKEILDRAGLPATTILQHAVTPYTADDYARAKQEAEEWEAKMRAPIKTEQSS